MQKWYKNDIASLVSITYDTLFDYDNLKKEGRTPMDENVDITPELDHDEYNNDASFRVICKPR